MKHIAKYTNENVWKEDWKKKYKYGVILFIPPEPVKTIVDDLRKKYDPESHKNCVAHISLTMPIRHALTAKEQKEFEQNIKNFKSFRVTYGPIINFLPDAPGVVFEIKEQDLFQKLYKHIENTQDIEFHSRKWPFKAHLTIAEFLDEDTTVQLTHDLNEELRRDFLYGNFMCAKVSYMVPDEDFVFQEIQSFDLGR